MSTLKEVLEEFKPEFRSELDNECFKGLAEAFLYGGYISVSDYKEERYRIFIRTVEFYCKMIPFVQLSGLKESNA